MHTSSLIHRPFRSLRAVGVLLVLLLALPTGSVLADHGINGTPGPKTPAVVVDPDPTCTSGTALTFTGAEITGGFTKQATVGTQTATVKLQNVAPPTFDWRVDDEPKAASVIVGTPADTSANVYDYDATGFALQHDDGLTSPDGELEYITFCLVEGAPNTHPFTDVAGNEFEEDITWIFNEGITLGCTETMYCPAGAVTRAQMASFLVRAGGLPAPTGDHFTDDEAYVDHEDDINSLFEAGITLGCGGTNFCPGAFVTRAQMASFLVRALGLPDPTGDHFTDDEAYVDHEDDINSLFEAGITNGCTATTFCPGNNVRRDEMAAFLHRAYGP